MFSQIMVAFITGLTTGGLSCLAVQGGLLAGSLAHQIEQDVIDQTSTKTVKPHIAMPILLFLISKLAAYTVLGFFLGWLGSMLQLTPFTRAILLIAIGVFMIGNALRMLNIHPIFRYFAFEPPSFVTRSIRKMSKNGADTFTPLFLGAVTVLIPCGVTQAMMAVAIGSASPVFGAAIMFAFILGTSPVFFFVSYFATKLGSTMEKYFMRFVAVIVLVLGLLSIEAGLNLAGSPVSFSRLSRSVMVSSQPVPLLPSIEAASAANPTPNPDSPDAKAVGNGMPCISCGGQSKLGDQAQGPANPVTPPAADTAVPVANTITLKANNDGYDPQTLGAPANTELTMNIVTENTTSCARAFVIPALNIEVVLPQSGVTPVKIPAQKPGTVIQFSCSMGMYTGQIEFK
ncbi:MAG: sulfite exporter TauE/SafE family protein [Chloroflexota bacterium]